MSIVIRQVAAGETEQLQQIGRQTFIETFSADNTEENIKKYLEEGFSYAQLSAELNNENSGFYFAVDQDKIVGYLKLNFGESQTELKEDKAMEIERIYVLNEYHGKKVGQLLYDKAIKVARENKADYVWLGVWEENPRAIRFYTKNGFKAFDKHVFKLGDDEQTDIMMKLQLG